jgi:signal transduction histidine kinase
MGRRAVVFKAVCVLVAIWVVVFGIRAIAGSKKITAERVEATVRSANFDDWSGTTAPPDAAEAKRRERELREIAGMINRLDFNEREKNRRNRSGEEFFRRLAPGEKSLFIDLTIVESMNRFMEALDGLPPAERKRFVEQGLKEIREGRTEEEMARADELSEDLLDRISSEGMRAYFEKASTDTKLDLAPLMEAMNEIMQGLRGNEFGPRPQQ